jgi:hypothetical protein
MWLAGLTIGGQSGEQQVSAGGHSADRFIAGGHSAQWQLALGATAPMFGGRPGIAEVIEGALRDRSGMQGIRCR